MRKKSLVITLLVGCLLFVGAYSFFYKTDDESEDFYLKTVVYKAKDNTLVPVSLNFMNQMDIEEEVLNRIDMMKSNELVSKGLYPLLSSNLQVNHIDLNDKVLTLDFNDELYANHNALDIIEALTYTLCDYDEVDSLKLQVNGKDIQTIPNSDMTVSSLTKSIGLNNFEETTYLLHHTYPVMVYQIKNIENHNYYVPTTTRINETLSVEEQVSTILSLINPQIKCLKASINNHQLNVVLDPSMLLEDGTIDKDLLNLMTLTLSSMKDIDKINIEINDEALVNETVSSIQLNYIKL